MQQICSYYKKLEDLSLKYAAAKDITEEQLNEILDYLDKTIGSALKYEIEHQNS